MADQENKKVKKAYTAEALAVVSLIMASGFAGAAFQNVMAQSYISDIEILRVLKEQLRGESIAFAAFLVAFLSSAYSLVSGEKEKRN